MNKTTPRIRTHPAEFELKTKALYAKRELLRRQAQSSLLGFTLFTKPDYATNWHHRAICKALDRFAKKEIKRLMIFMPPRYGKSELVSRRLPAYLLGRNPNTSIIATSYSADLASMLNRDVQRIIDSYPYREVFPNTQLFGSETTSPTQGSWIRNSELFEIVGHRGFYRSAGVGGGITGLGADFLILDDPIKNQEEAYSETIREKLWEWYISTPRTRLEKDGSILITQTRWHEDDLSSRLMKLAETDKSADQWVIVSFPALGEESENLDDPRTVGEALWPEKFPLQELEMNRAALGSSTFQAMYQQNPVSLQGNIFRREWFRFYREVPEKYDEVIQSWDMAFRDTKNSDFVVGQVWIRAGANKFLIDQTRGRMDFAATVRAVRAMSEKYPNAKVKLVEAKANGDAVISTLRNEISGLIPVEPQGGKESRANSVTPEFESGNIYFPDPALQPWVKDLMDELASFPKGRNDDQVDAISQALIRFQTSSKQSFDFDFSINDTLVRPSVWFR